MLGSHLPPPSEKGWEWGREGLGGEGQTLPRPPKSLRFEGGLSRVGIFQGLQLGLQFGDLKNSKGERSQRGGGRGARRGCGEETWGWGGGDGRQEDGDTVC